MSSLFPTLRVEEDVDRFLDPITSQEVEVVLKGFKKDKIPSLNGWPVELFLFFFILLGKNWCWLFNRIILVGESWAHSTLPF